MTGLRFFCKMVMMLGIWITAAQTGWAQSGPPAASGAVPLKIQLFDKASGQPIAGGDVYYGAEQLGRPLSRANDFFKWTRRLKTDKAGAASLSESGSAPLSLCVTAPGHESVVLTPAKRQDYLSGDTIKVPLGLCGSISGVVTVDGNPGAGILVDLEFGVDGLDYLGISADDWTGIHEAETKTDSVGRYRFDGLKPGNYRVLRGDVNPVYTPEKFFRKWLPLKAGENAVMDFSVGPRVAPSTPAAAVTPAAPAVAAASAPPSPPPASPAPVNHAVTMRLKTQSAVAGKPCLEVGDLFLRRFENGKPCEGDGDYFWGHENLGLWVFSGDMHGEFRLERRVRHYPSQYLPQTFTIDTRKGAQDLGELSLTLEALVSLRGSVLDASGTPLPGARIELYGALDGGLRSNSFLADADGRFSFNKLLPDGYEIHVAPQAGGPAGYWTSLKLAADTENVTLRPGKQPQVAIPLLFSPGLEAARRARFARALLVRAERGARMPTSSDYEKVARHVVNPFPADKLVFRGKYQGRFKLWIEYQPAPGLIYVAKIPLSVPLDNMTSDQALPPFKVPAPGRISLEGRVLDRAGVPQRWARIELDPGFPTPWSGLAVKADEQGRFKLLDLPAGAYVARVSAAPASDMLINGFRQEGRPLGSVPLTLTKDTQQDLVIGGATFQ